MSEQSKTCSITPARWQHPGQRRESRPFWRNSAPQCRSRSGQLPTPGHPGFGSAPMRSLYSTLEPIVEGSLNRNFRQYGELKSSSRVVTSVDKRSNSQKDRRKTIRPRQMLEKSRNAVFFHRFACRVSPTVGLLKRRVRRLVLRGDIKNCTPLWRKAHSQVKMSKTPQSRTTFGS